MNWQYSRVPLGDDLIGFDDDTAIGELVLESMDEWRNHEVTRLEFDRDMPVRLALLSLDSPPTNSQDAPAHLIILIFLGQQHPIGFLLLR